MAFLRDCADKQIIFETDKQQSKRLKQKPTDNSQTYRLQLDFRNKLTELRDAAYSREEKNLNRNYGISKINKFLKEQNIPFSVESNKGWIVVGCERSNDNCENPDKS